jgi:hypothetical protein
MVLHNYFKKVHKRSFEEYLSQYIHINKCGFCNDYSYIKSCSIKFLNNFSIIISDIEYFVPYKCRNLNKSCTSKNYNPNSVDFVTKAYEMKHEDALNFIHDRNKSPFYKNNFKSEEEYKQSQKRDKNYFINKYGEELGNKKFNQYKQNHKYSYTENAYVKKYGKDGIEIKKSIDKSKALTKEKLGEERWNAWKNKWNNKKSDFINKYGSEIGEEKYNDYIKLKSYQNTLQYYIDQYGEKQGTIKWKEKNKKCSIAEEKLGKEKYKQWKEKVSINNFKFNNSSKEAWKFFKPIVKYCFLLGMNKSDIYIGTKSRNEYYIRNENNFYLYDFCIKQLHIIIEYNGEKFHPNPNWDKEKWNNWKCLYTNESADEKYKKDRQKIKVAKKHNFIIEEVFSSDDFDEKYKYIFNLIRKQYETRINR